MSVLDLSTMWDPQGVPARADWERLAALDASDVPDPVVDVLIPVYGSREHSLRTIYSVLTSRAQTPHRVIVLDDASPDAALADDLVFVADLGLIELHRNEQNLGFPGNCNRGFALHPDRDVVLLNSDTLVYNDWLDRLRAHVVADQTIATVTPLTNNGEICGYPRTLAPNDDPLEVTPQRLDQLAATTNPGVRVDAPTGVGFCMYVTRSCLQITDGFDAEAFGAGYGEENDLCQRAERAGMRNVLVADLFVWHRGGVTFGESKDKRVEAAVRLVEQRNPGYRAAVRAYVIDDPLLEARRRLDAARIARRSAPDSPTPATLLVYHTLLGGTERHVFELKDELESQGRAAYFCQPTGQGGRFAIRDPRLPNTPNLETFTFKDSPEQMGKIFALLGIDTLHIHHLLGFSQGSSDYFLTLAEDLGLALDVTIHDYAPICPRINLISSGGLYCGEPAVDACQRCIDLLGSPFGHQVVWKWRRDHERLLRGARTVSAPSADVAKRIGRYFPGLHIEVRPHVEPAVEPITPVVTAPDSTARIGVIGALASHKGANVVLDVARRAAELDAPVEIVIIGYSLNIDEKLDATGKVRITGKYHEAELRQLMHDARLDAVWFPAVWPETYCYTLTPALENSLPIVAFDLGAVAERLRAAGRTEWIVPIGLATEPDDMLRTLQDAAGGMSPVVALH